MNLPELTYKVIKSNSECRDECDENCPLYYTTSSCKFICFMEDCDKCYLKFQCATEGDTVSLPKKVIIRAAKRNVFKRIIVMNSIFEEELG